MNESPSFKQQAIPPLQEVTGWRNIEIVECGETLVPLSNYAPQRIKTDPQYYKMGIENAVNECFVREQVALRLLNASNFLPAGYQLVIWDGWRPIEVQSALFESFKNKLAAQHPNWDGNYLVEMTQKYVSLPSVDRSRPSPHNTGGAVDLSIADQHGIMLSTGTEFDAFEEIAATRYYEMKPANNLTPIDIECRYNRRLLFFSMTTAGFTNYNEEWWHYDFGNQFWAVQKNEKAIYGHIAP